MSHFLIHITVSCLYFQRQLNVKGYQCSTDLRYVLFKHNIKYVSILTHPIQYFRLAVVALYIDSKNFVDLLATQFVYKSNQDRHWDYNQSVIFKHH